MRMITLACCALFSLLGVAPTYSFSAQEGTNPENNQLFFVEISNFTAFHNDELIVDEILKNIRLDGYEIIPLPTKEDADKHPNYWENPSLHISFSQPDPATLYVMVTPYSNFTLFENEHIFSTFDLSTVMTVPLHEQDELLSTASTITEALALYRLGNCADTVELLKSVSDEYLVQFHSEKSIAFYLGTCALLGADFGAAQSYFDPITAIPDTDLWMFPNATYNAAWTYLQLAETDSAINLVDRIEDSVEINGNPRSTYDDVAVYTTSARIKALAFQYADALDSINRAVELEPETPALYVERGKITLLLYEWDRVIADYSYAIELDPTYADAYFYRGVLNYSVLAREDALNDFEAYLTLAPGGSNSVDAAEYAESIRTELEALSAL